MPFIAYFRPIAGRWEAWRQHPVHRYGGFQGISAAIVALEPLSPGPKTLALSPSQRGRLTWVGTFTVKTSDRPVGNGRARQ